MQKVVTRQQSGDERTCLNDARTARFDPEATFDNPVGSSRTNSFVFDAIKNVREVRMDDDEVGIPGARGADATEL